MSGRPLRFLFVSGTQAWGGCEELWSATAAMLASEGHRVSVLVTNVNPAHRRIRRLRELGCSIGDLARMPLLPRTVSRTIARIAHPAIAANARTKLAAAIAFAKPDLVLVSQGSSFGGPSLANVCRRMKVRYVIVSHKADELHWPSDDRLEQTRATYLQAAAVWFVSEHNRRLTQEQLGIELPHSAIVRNPYLVPWERRDDWPSADNGLRLACVGRLHPAEKGQDLVIRLLARDKWRARPLSVTFFGNGPQARILADMTRNHQLTSIRFAGFVEDVASIWNDHHGLLLPSRAEGMPLVLVEAMLSGRITIATDVAGHRELIEDGHSGFLAASPTEAALDEALERAWQRRDEWPSIGTAAANHIRTLVPADPVRTFADALLQLIETAPESRPALFRFILPP